MIQFHLHTDLLMFSSWFLISPNGVGWRGLARTRQGFAKLTFARPVSHHLRETANTASN
jgi:hypothetical protein